MGKQSFPPLRSDNLRPTPGHFGGRRKIRSGVFLRVHRSSIINLRRVREAHRYGKSYDVTMENGDVVRVSRGYMDLLRDLTF